MDYGHCGVNCHRIFSNFYNEYLPNMDDKEMDALIALALICFAGALLVYVLRKPKEEENPQDI